MLGEGLQYGFGDSKEEQGAAVRCDAVWCSYPQEWHGFELQWPPWAYSTIPEIPAGRRTMATDGPTMGPESMMAGGADERHCLVTPTGVLKMPA